MSGLIKMLVIIHVMKASYTCSYMYAHIKIMRTAECNETLIRTACTARVSAALGMRHMKTSECQGRFISRIFAAAILYSLNKHYLRDVNDNIDAGQCMFLFYYFD